MKTSNPLKWHGGKFYLADWIISLMPEHKHYVEPYFGGGAVLFRKNCEGSSEVVNDINKELSNFWNVIRSDKIGRLLRKLECTPFSEDCFTSATQILSVPQGDPVLRAWAFFVKYRQSRQGLGKDFATLSRTRTRRGMNEQVSSWLSAIEGLPEAKERLQRVVILNRDALDVIRQQDGPDTFFYLDPPYLHQTRTTTYDYEHEMGLEDHEELLSVLEEVSGKFLLSGYPSNMYESWRQRNGFTRHEKAIDNKASSKKKKETKIECLWANY